MILSDRDLLQRLKTDLIITNGFDPKRIQPASIDLTLGHLFRFFHDGPEMIDPRHPVEQLMTLVDIRQGDFFRLAPGQFVLAETNEMLQIPVDLVGRLEGCSSVARDGLIIHTAGFFDPGFNGTATLEISNLNRNRDVALVPGQKIGQIAFTKLTTPAERPYGRGRASHYANQYGPTPSRLHLDFEEHHTNGYVK